MFSEYLIIEQADGWWIMQEGMGLGPYPSRKAAEYWAGGVQSVDLAETFVVKARATTAASFGRRASS
jgi:hypothetical protein